MVRKWRDQKEIPTPKTDVGKNYISNLGLVTEKAILSLRSTSDQLKYILGIIVNG